MGNHEKVFAFCDSGCKVEVLPLDYMIGMIFQYAGATAPEGFLICDGKEIEREKYKKLFNAIGTNYGLGDGSTTFNLPNLKGRVPVGLDDNDVDFKTLGKTGGEKTHQLTVDEMPIHNHSASTVIANGGAHIHSASSSNNGSHSHSISGTANSAGNHYHETSCTGYKAGSKNWQPSGNTGAVTNWGYDIGTANAGAHTHSLSGSTNSTGGHAHTITVNSGGSHNHTATTSIGESGGGKAHNNLQPYIVINYIIKY